MTFDLGSATDTLDPGLRTDARAPGKQTLTSRLAPRPARGTPTPTATTAPADVTPPQGDDPFGVHLLAATPSGADDAQLGDKQRLLLTWRQEMIAVADQLVGQFAPLGLRFRPQILLATAMQEADAVDPLNTRSFDDGLGMMQITPFDGQLDPDVASAIGWDNAKPLEANIRDSRWRDARANLLAGAQTMLAKARAVRQGAAAVWAEMDEAQRWRAVLFAYNAGEGTAIQALLRGGPAAPMISSFVDASGQRVSHDYTAEIQQHLDYVDAHDPFGAPDPVRGAIDGGRQLLDGARRGAAELGGAISGTVGGAIGGVTRWLGRDKQKALDPATPAPSVDDEPLRFEPAIPEISARTTFRPAGAPVGVTKTKELGDLIKGVDAAVRGGVRAVGDGVERIRDQGGRLLDRVLPRSDSQRILDDRGIELYDQQFGHPLDGADARANITDDAAGRSAKRSHYGNAPGGTVKLSPVMLAAIVALRGRGFRFAITAIAGASHSEGSLHYDGVAFDIDEVNGIKVTQDSALNREFMAACEALGAIEVLGPSNRSDHQDHIHCAWAP